MTDETTEPDRRASVRAKRPIEIEYSADCPPIRARLDDLSETGAFIDTAHSLGEGAHVIVRFTLPDDAEDDRIQCHARVVWVEPMVGVGVEFVGLDQRSVERIRDYVAKELFGW
ncbi:MAG TPA: PilZ domain-containing protein [Thermoanaerobaculia bacterium]|nr:PilZ domain-containing protein [Thermoanaerobaculia bacterium]